MLEQVNHTVYKFHLYVYLPYCLKGWDQYFFKESNAFIQQVCIKLIKSHSKDIYNVT